MRPTCGAADSVSAQRDNVSKWVQIVIGLTAILLVVVIPLLMALTEEVPEPAADSGAHVSDHETTVSEGGESVEVEEPAGVSGASPVPDRSSGGD
jgi:hypothetical protein